MQRNWRKDKEDGGETVSARDTKPAGMGGKTVDESIALCFEGYNRKRPESCTDPSVRCLSRCKELEEYGHGTEN